MIVRDLETRICKDFTVEPKWILELYQQRKISATHAAEEIIKSRGRGAIPALSHLDALSNKETMLDMRAEIERVQESLSRGMSTYREHPIISSWMDQYKVENYGVISRFTSLLLTGPSRIGKSWKALSLFGAASTLKVNCQGLPVGSLPSLSGFNRSRHKAILFDEVRPDQVLGNKELFQAGAWPVALAQSNCGAFAYEVWVYGIAMILCSNFFPVGSEEQSSEEADWLKANIAHAWLPEDQRWFLTDAS